MTKTAIVQDAVVTVNVLNVPLTLVEDLFSYYVCGSSRMLGLWS